MAMNVVNWVADATPVVCQGIGGRQVRTGPEFGNVFDHFAVRYEYGDGLTMFAMATQQRGISIRIGNVIHGTRGTARVDRGSAAITAAVMSPGSRPASHRPAPLATTRWNHR